MQTADAKQALAEYIATNGPIKAARVSSAKAKGYAKNFAYFGVVDYEIRLRKSDGAPTAVAVHAAGSDRRSLRLAQADLRQHCAATGRIAIDGLGPVTDREALSILNQLHLVEARNDKTTTAK